MLIKYNRKVYYTCIIGSITLIIALVLLLIYKSKIVDIVGFDGDFYRTYDMLLLGWFVFMVICSIIVYMLVDRSYNKVLDIMYVDGDIDKFLNKHTPYYKAVKGMSNWDVTIINYQLEAYIKHGDLDIAKDIISNLIDNEKSISTVYLKGVTFVNCARYYFAKDDKDKAKDYIDKVKSFLYGENGGDTMDSKQNSALRIAIERVSKNGEV